MKQPDRDIAVRAALQRGGRATPIDTASLAARVKRAAGYDLFRRRHPVASPSDYIARWSRTLLPIGCVCTFAGAVVLVHSHAVTADAARIDETALVGAATNRITTPQLVDMVLRQAEEPQQTQQTRQTQQTLQLQRPDRDPRRQ
jgi:hypothetical protein